MSGDGVVLDRLAVYYHVYATPAGVKITTENMHAIERAELLDRVGRVHVGIVGAPDARDHAKRELAAWPVDVVAEADTGWEQVTLGPLHAAAKAGQFDRVAYLHSKGASRPDDRFRAAWRDSMIAGVVTRWRECVDYLATVDVVGCHWVDSDRPGNPQPYFLMPVRAFVGNMWWARSSYLARLDPPRRRLRNDAETWLGTGNPWAHNLTQSGWPGWETFLQRDDLGLDLAALSSSVPCRPDNTTDRPASTSPSRELSPRAQHTSETKRRRTGGAVLAALVGAAQTCQSRFSLPTKKQGDAS